MGPVPKQLILWVRSHNIIYYTISWAKLFILEKCCTFYAAPALSMSAELRQQAAFKEQNPTTNRMERLH